METFVTTPVDLITGNATVVTKGVTIAAGADVAQYTVLGQVTASGKFIPCVPTAVDGSQKPVAIAAVAAAAADADVDAPVYLQGVFNPTALVWNAGFTDVLKATAFIGSPITLIAPGYSG